MRTAIFLISLFSVFGSWACDLVVPAHILLTAGETGSWPFLNTNCSPGQTQELIRVLQDQHGVIPVSRLEAAMSKGIRLSSDKRSVRVTNVERLIRGSFNGIGEAKITLSAPFSSNLISVPEDAEFTANCHPCQFQGEEIIRLSLSSFSEQARELNFQAKFVSLVKAYKLRRSLPAFSTGLTLDMLEEVTVPTPAFGQYLTDASQISFFKTNKMLKAGDFLRSSDLSPITLVRAGDRVELIFENDHVTLKSQALARQNGGKGDSVEVWNQATGKKHRGTVTDHNKVVVEL